MISSKYSFVKQVLISDILTQMRCMSVNLDLQDELRKFYHHELRLEVSDTGYSHELCPGPPVEKITYSSACITIRVSVH